jgi:MFS transporter, SP family, arabinose:H+ symporter
MEVALKLSGQLIRAAFAGALAGLLFGFDTAVISGTTDSLVHAYSLSPFQLGLTVSIALVGTVISAISAGIIGQKLGSRATLRLTAVLYIISAIGSAFALNWPMLLIARFIGGLGIGASSVVGPVYIAEIAPASWRGRMVGMFQINIVVGILVAYLSNYGVQHLNVGGLEWRVQFGVAIVPALLFFVMLFGIPQSPRWLITQDRPDEARAVLEKIGESDPDAEIHEIAAAVQNARMEHGESLFVRRYSLPIFLALSIGVLNQLSGINAILYYLNDIFTGAGFSKFSGGAQAVAVGLVNMLATFLAMSVIDKMGRKKLLLIGSVGMIAALSGVTVIFAKQQHQQELLPLLILYIFSFAISQGAVIWVYISEIFPSTVRSKGQALGCTAHWGMNALIALTFPVIAAHSHAAPFGVFAAMMVVQFLVVLFVYPETKGISLEALEKKLGLTSNTKTSVNAV